MKRKYQQMKTTKDIDRDIDNALKLQRVQWVRADKSIPDSRVLVESVLLLRTVK